MVLSKKIPLISTLSCNLRPGNMVRFEIDDIPARDSHMVLAKVISVMYFQPFSTVDNQYHIAVLTDSGSVVLTSDRVVYVHPDLFSDAWQKAQFDDPAPSSEEISELLDFAD